MIRPLISILTLYQIDDTLFESMELPERPFTDRGYENLFLTGWDLDKDTLVENLLMELAELNVLYTDPAFMKYAITTWSKKQKAVWQALYETLFFKYNPIWNKDGTLKHTAEETRNLANGLTITGTGSGTMNEISGNVRETDADETIQRSEILDRTTSESGSGTDTETTTPGVTDTSTVTYNVTDTKTNTSANTGTDSNETKVSAFDASTYQNREKTDLTKNTTTTDNGSNVRTGTETTQTAHSGHDLKETESAYEKDFEEHLTRHEDDTTRAFDEKITDSGSRSQTTSSTDSRTQSGTNTGTVETEFTDLEQGNIGVVTTQAMIEAERNLVRFNIYDLIIDDFKQRFCVLIY